jgi:DNA invertase Pin-like site-specific DNA recombinase
LVCFKLDRIGRSLPHLVSIHEDLEKRGVHVISTEDGLSTKGSTGKFVLNIMAAVVQFERSLILERTRAGPAAAKARGKLPGRRRVMEPIDVVRARKLLDAGELSSHDVAAMFKVSRITMSGSCAGSGMSRNWQEDDRVVRSQRSVRSATESCWLVTETLDRRLGPAIK